MYAGKVDVPSSWLANESWEEEAEEEDNGPGEGGGLAVWKLRGEVEFILEALEIESVSEVIIKRDWMGIRKGGYKRQDTTEPVKNNLSGSSPLVSLR